MMRGEEGKFLRGFDVLVRWEGMKIRENRNLTFLKHPLTIRGSREKANHEAKPVTREKERDETLKKTFYYLSGFSNEFLLVLISSVGLV